MVTIKLWYVSICCYGDRISVSLQESFSNGLLLAMMSLLHQQSDQLLYKTVINTWSHFIKVSQQYAQHVHIHFNTLVITAVRLIILLVNIL